MIKQTVYNAFTGITPSERNAIIKFLCQNQEGYGVDRRSISNALDYAVKDCPSFGGFVLVMEEDKEVVGTVVINRTGMEGYNAENVLAYFSTHLRYRNNGLGRKMMEKAMENVKGDIALHLTPNHPERGLFEELGFQARYLEMRLDKLKPKNSVLKKVSV